MKLFSALTLFAAEEGGFHPPSIMEFYPEIVAFEGTIFAINRIMMIRLIVLAVLLVLFYFWTRSFKRAVRTGNVVPGRFQLLGEMALNFVRKNIAHDQLGEKDGDRWQADEKVIGGGERQEKIGKTTHRYNSSADQQPQKAVEEQALR